MKRDASCTTTRRVNVYELAESPRGISLAGSCRLKTTEGLGASEKAVAPFLPALTTNETVGARPQRRETRFGYSGLRYSGADRSGDIDLSLFNTFIKALMSLAPV